MYSVVWERCTVLFLTQLILHRALDIVHAPSAAREARYSHDMKPDATVTDYS